jgi:hypothetical protein
MQDPATRGYQRSPRSDTTTRNPALAGPLLTFMVRRVDGSSPSEALQKAPQSGAFSFASICTACNLIRGWSILWSSEIAKCVRSLCASVLAPETPPTRRAVRGNQQLRERTLAHATEPTPLRRLSGLGSEHR